MASIMNKEIEKKLNELFKQELELEMDLLIYGNCFYKTDAFGIKTRIDPLTILPEELIYKGNDK